MFSSMRRRFHAFFLLALVVLRACGEEYADAGSK